MSRDAGYSKSYTVTIRYTVSIEINPPGYLPEVNDIGRDRNRQGVEACVRSDLIEKSLYTHTLTATLRVDGMNSSDAVMNGKI